MGLLGGLKKNLLQFVDILIVGLFPSLRSGVVVQTLRTALFGIGQRLPFGGIIGVGDAINAPFEAALELSYSRAPSDTKGIDLLRLAEVGRQPELRFVRGVGL